MKPEIEQKLRDALHRIVSGAQHRYKATPPEDLADELDQLLMKANLAMPPVLLPKQYNAVAEVWQALGDNLGEVEALAGRALMMLSHG